MVIIKKINHTFVNISQNFNLFTMTEFGLIESIKSLFSTIPTNNFEGIGDDCAVLSLGDEALVFTTDMLIEDIHFVRSSTSAYDLGYKSLAVNLSDVAAMGVAPVASMLSISLPKELMGSWVEEFMRGYHALSEKYGVALIGGDTTASKDRLSINITAIGRGATTNIKRRNDAREGDIIAVTGSIGESGAGLKDILDGKFDTPLAKIHKCPEPHVEEGAWLGSQSAVHAMMDISDGVASDLRHILKLSSLGAAIELESIPSSVDLRTALCAGEDYKLLLTVDQSQFDTLATLYYQHFARPLYRIGVIEQGSSLRWLDRGEEQSDEFMGFRHY